jgi:hypothetical protein
MVIARLLPAGGSTPKVRLIFPSVSYTADSRVVDEYITDRDETLTFGQLTRTGRKGWSFYTKIGVRPWGSRHDIWWPAGNSGRTRDHVEAIFQQKSAKATLLNGLYLPANREREFTLDGLMNELNISGRENVRTRLNELAKAGLIKHRPDSGRELISPRHPGKFRALNASEIQRRDAKLILERVREYPSAMANLERRILDHMYRAENRSRQFAPEDFITRLVLHSMDDERGRSLLSTNLRLLMDAGLVKRISQGRSHSSALYEAYQDDD